MKSYSPVAFTISSQKREDTQVTRKRSLVTFDQVAQILVDSGLEEPADTDLDAGGMVGDGFELLEKGS